MKRIPNLRTPDALIRDSPGQEVAQQELVTEARPGEAARIVVPSPAEPATRMVLQSGLNESKVIR